MKVGQFFTGQTANVTSSWVEFSDDSAIVFSLIGTGSANATVFIDLEDHQGNAIRIHNEAFSGANTKAVQLDGVTRLYKRARAGIASYSAGTFEANYVASRNPK